MSLSDSQFSWVLGALLAAAALTEYGVMSITLLENNISPFATWVFMGTLTGAYLVSQRELGALSDWELLAFGTGVGGFALYKLLPEFQQVFTDYQPESGIVMFVLTMIAFYILTNEDI